MDHILVTGSSGMIGTGLCKRLSQSGYTVTGIDRTENRWSESVQERTLIADLRQMDLAETVPNSVDVIVHLAANARVHELVETPERALQNYTSTFEVLNYARETGTHIIFGSSREVYGNQLGSVLEESEVSLERSASPYSASKIGEESMVRAFANCYDLSATVLRFSNVYGRFDASNRVVPLFLTYAKRGLPLTVFGSDKFLDFTYLTDCIDGILAAIEHRRKARGETFNIASGKASTLVELAEIVVDALDSDSSIVVEPPRTGEVTQFVADLKKARRYLDYVPNFDLDTGIEKTIGWYEDRNLYDEILANDG